MAGHLSDGKTLSRKREPAGFDPGFDPGRSLPLGRVDRASRRVYIAIMFAATHRPPRPRLPAPRSTAPPALPLPPPPPRAPPPPPAPPPRPPRSPTPPPPPPA